MSEDAPDAQTARILSIVRRQLSDPDIGFAARQSDHPRWDSGAMVDILFEIEEAFDVTFTSAEMEAVDSVATLRQQLDAALARAAAELERSRA